MRLHIVLLTILALILAACATPGEEPYPPAGGEETVQPTATEDATAVPTTTSTPSVLACESLPEVTTEGESGVTVPENAVAVFQKTGGFAGVMETTVIYADGFIENDQGESYQASPQEIESLVTTATAAGFFDLNRNYIPEGYCCDFFNYSLTIRDCDQANTVMTADQAPGTPAELWQIIDTVQSLIGNTSAAILPVRIG